MLGIERRQLIFSTILERGSITVGELSSLCAVGEETIRRDLNKMSSEGLIEKIYGGAVISNRMHSVLPVSTRKIMNVEGKKSIAEYCISIIEDGDTIFLDGSTTALEIAASLKNCCNLVVITNSAEAACRIPETPGLKVICIGGTMRPKTKTFVGHSTVMRIKEYYANKAFICCDGADMDRGITDANEHEAEVRRAMMQHASAVELIADSSKFNKTSFVSLSGFEGIDTVVTDYQLPEQWKEFLEQRKVSYKICSVDRNR